MTFRPDINISILLAVIFVTSGSAMAGTAEDAADMGCFCRGAVGNINCDYEDIVSIDDLQLLVDHLFNDFSRLPNLEEANCSGDPEGVIDIVDLQVLVDHLFLSTAPLPDCPSQANNPPETRILGRHGERFINSVEPGSPTFGISIEWAGSELVDHPYYPPPFEFEWCLYGPYDDSLFEELRDSFMIPVFITNDKRIFRFGLPPDTIWDTIVDGPFTQIIPTLVPTHTIICDTSYAEGEQVVECDTLLIDTISIENDYGSLDTLFDVDAPGLAGKDSKYYRPAASSFDGVDTWVYDRADTLYDVYAQYPVDTTAQMNFVFWVRSRDPMDSTLYDPVPDFQIMSVIEARQELDVLVIDVGLLEAVNSAVADSAREFWTRTINNWRTVAAAGPDVFLPQRDYIRIVDHLSDPDFLLLLMKYKVMVLLQDAVTSSIFGSQDTEVVKSLYQALQSGVNTWLSMRTPLGSFAQGSEPAFALPGSTYQQYFGVERIKYSGWSYYARRAVPTIRIEDFTGATSRDSLRWPHLSVDSALLHRRYTWPAPYYQWIDTLAALPGVGYCETVPEAEIMYTYNSLYGSEHNLGEEFSYDGRPVMHRLDSGGTRTVHSLFTPLALEAEEAQILVERVVNWLCCGEEP